MIETSPAPYTLDEALDLLWPLADKPERMRVFHKIVSEIGIEDGTRFWSEFWRIWDMSENLFDDMEFLPDLIAMGRMLGDPRCTMSKAERFAFKKMPDPLTIYRGCLEFNQDGWSWTIDQKKARWFAGRSYGAPDRFVLRGEVRKHDVLAFLTGRGENEIVVDPENVHDIEIEELFEVDEGKAMGGLAWAVQTGRFNQLFDENDQMVETQVRMQVHTMGDAPITDEQIEQVEKAAKFCGWAGLERLRYYHALAKVLREKQADPGLVLWPPKELC